ncbi:glycosyltransferase [Microbacterium sp. P07]|uniref:glycosyltransferase n=1 Tax=Microbacterium sp. P07 TaxID=3366952 RepID=UPI003744DA15
MPPEKLRVLEVVNPPDGTTRYIDQVVEFADDDIEFSYISPLKMARMNYDVVHFHWPEMILRHRITLLERAKCLVFDLWVRALRWRRIGILRTLHNLEPHDGVTPVVQRSLRRLDDATDEYVTINTTTEARSNSTYIPHGHYRDRFANHEKPDAQRGRLLYAGLIRPYKGVETLLDAFDGINASDASLRVVGKPTPEFRGLIEEKVAADPTRLSARLEFVPDEDFVGEIRSAELVCLPYRELHNSGMMLVALSLDRPVLVPDTPSTRALDEEVGPGWVIRYHGDLDAAGLDAALATVRSGSRSSAPKLDRRDWQLVGAAYSAAFRETRDIARRR